MTETAVRPEVVKLLADVDICEDAPIHERHHYDGRPVTSTEAEQLRNATLREVVESNRLHFAYTEALGARTRDAQRFTDLLGRYLEGEDRGVTIAQVLGVMPPAERAEAEAILARLNGDGRDYVAATQVQADRCTVCPDCLKGSCDMGCYQEHGCMLADH